MKRSWPEHLDRAARFLWALTLVCLPITSFRYLVFMGKGAQVQPLAMLPAALLLLVLLLKSIRQRRLLVWNASLVPLLAFLLVALVASAVGFFFAPLDLYDFTYSSRLLRAWVTLAVGLLFFLVALGMGRTERDVNFSLKWLYVGIAGHIFWGAMQLLAFYILRPYLNPPFNDIVDLIQRNVMVVGMSPNERISGLALEPSWLAAQVTALYLPWAFTAVLKSYHWSKRAWLSGLILQGCVFLMLFTYSRSGILTAALVVFATFVLTGGRWMRQTWQWFTAPFRPSARGTEKRARQAILRALVASGALGMVTVIALVLGRNDYFATMWSALADSKDPLDYLINIYAGPRLAYAYAGWQVFAAHPWSGVGLGGLGLYLHAQLPAWSHFNMPEVAHYLASSNTTYPNSKNLYIRLLSETGIFGFWLFVSFYSFVLGKIVKLLRSVNKEVVFIGVAGLCSWLAIVLLGMSQDSFAMATIWIPLGLTLGLAEGRE